MEAFPSLQSAPQSTMMHMQMDMQMQMPQHTPQPQSVSLSPGRCIVPHRQVMKGECENEEGENDGELLFGIEEFLVEEEALIHGNSGDENEGATIIAESPTNTSTNSNPSILFGKKSNDITNHPIPATINTTATATTIINSHNNNTTIHKKRRKRRSRSKAKLKNGDNCAPPKRPLSGYNLYFREERKRCVSETKTETTSSNSQGSSKPSKKYNFEELGKLIGKRWKSLPLKEKRELEVQAEADRERYRNEMIAYRRERRRKDMKEDEDTLIMMRQRTACRHSPTLSMPSREQHLPEVFSPLQRHMTVSPGQRDCHAQKEQQPFQEDKQLLRPEDAGKNQRVRKVSVSISSPPYPRENIDFRSRNNASPAVFSYGNCSSWSGDESEDDDDDRNCKYSNENDEDGSKGICTVRSDNSNRTLSNKAMEHLPTPSSIPRSHLHVPCFENASHKLPTVPPHGVAVARVVAMPATDGLQRILQDGHPSKSLLPAPGVHKQQPQPPQLPYSWIPRMNARPQQYLYHHQQQHPYLPPPPPSPVAGDRHQYTPPPHPPQGSFGAPHISPHIPPHQTQHPQQHQHPHRPQQQQQQQHPPQILPLGMEIFLQDPATGRERSYRVQYTHKYMTAEQANQFQRLHDGGLQNTYLQGNNNHSRTN
jgi:hypothetical protein